MLGTGSVCKGQGDSDEVQKEDEEEEEDQSHQFTMLPIKHDGDQEKVSPPRITFNQSSTLHELKEEDESPESPKQMIIDEPAIDLKAQCVTRSPQMDKDPVKLTPVVVSNRGF